MDNLPPICLAAPGIRLWNALMARAPIPGHLCEVALLACKQADRANECREILRSETLCVQDEKGNVKTHPAVEIERKASVACAQLVKEVIGKLDAETKEAIAQEEDFFA